MGRPGVEVSIKFGMKESSANITKEKYPTNLKCDEEEYLNDGGKWSGGIQVVMIFNFSPIVNHAKYCLAASSLPLSDQANINRLLH